MNWSEEKIIRLIYIMNHEIKMIGNISPNRYINISSYINKVVIKHISYVPRIHMDNIIMNYLLYSISTLRFFVLMMLFMISQVRFISLFAELNLCS